MQRRHHISAIITAVCGLRKRAAACTVLILVSATTSWIPCGRAAVDLSDTPMFNRIQPPPANIMFLMDDSGSMNFEILVRGEFDGSFPNPAKSDSELAADPHGFCYIFDDVGDNVYPQSDTPDWYAGPEGRKYWKSQWHIVNVMYYNPHVTYIPWPGYAGTTFTDANPHTPRSHPVLNTGCTLDLDATSFTIGTIRVPHAHYFAYSAAENRPYLIVVERDSIRYYAVSVVGTGLAEKISALTPAGSPPDDVLALKNHEAERQNFANWFTYHRRREFVAKNAVAAVIKSMADVRIGIYGLNQRIVAPLEPVMVKFGTIVQDNSDALLEKLFIYSSGGGTPLKQGLHTIGSYYKDNTGILGGVSGPKPYADSGLGAACQQSFTVVLTDGYYTDLAFSPSMIGNSDGDNAAPYSDAFSNSLADIAMYYYENDLSDLPDQVPANMHDRAAHQHMTTYAVAFGVNGTLSPADYDASFRHADTGRFVTWPEVTCDRTPETIDDLWHATVNGRGRFFNAAGPQELTAALNDMMSAIAEVLIGSASAVTVNGDSHYGKIGNDTFLYQGTYSTRDSEWTGDVKAFRLNPATGDIISNPFEWSAAQKLEAKDWDRRLIATFDGTGGIAFDENSLTGSQLAALGPDPASAVKYLRGAHVSGWRPRSRKLGDIVHSAPVFADGVIYCGANDGMLHAFDAETGEELFAYVPNLVFANLKLLADPAYAHRFYVDLTPCIKKGDGILGGSDSKSLLVGGLRKGGRGYFALDITSARTITTVSDLAARVLWEFPQTRDPDMGYSYSRPVIVKSNSPACPWLVIFGNGYDSDSGKSVLFIVNPGDGRLIKKIEADAGPDNGLSSPIAVDVTHDGKADFVYAGDLTGKLWKFDLSQDAIESWKVAYNTAGIPNPLFQAMGPAGSLQPITTRPDVMFHPEKHGLIVCFGTGKYLGDSDFGDMSLQSVYGIWDYGDRIYTQKTRTWSQDDDDEYLGAFIGRTSAPYLSHQPETVKLLQQVRRDHALTIGGNDMLVRVLSADKPIWETIPDPDNAYLQKPDPSNSKVNDAGYYFDLSVGERIISDVSIRDAKLIVIGFTPNADPCGPGGRSMFMEINAFTGGNPGSALIDINRDRKVDSRDLVRVDFDSDGVPEDVPPAGLEFVGNLQPPAILGFGGGGDVENKYMNSSTGTVEILCERPPKLGVTYWMEIRY